MDLNQKNSHYKNQQLENQKEFNSEHIQNQLDQYGRYRNLNENYNFIRILLGFGLMYFKNGLAMSGIKESLQELKMLLKDEEKRKPFIDALRQNESLKSQSKSNFDEDLYEVLSLIFKIGNHNSDILEERINYLESELDIKAPFVERLIQRQQKATSKNISKANDFAWKLKDTLAIIEKNLEESLHHKPSLRKIADELNRRNIPTPNNRGVWGHKTVKLIQDRIVEIQRNGLLNLQE